jgi:hypothetical protein
VVAYTLVHSDPPRIRLRKLDRLLDDLEDLNLNEMTHLPNRVGSALRYFGVAEPQRRSISELIDEVFELQEPLLETLRTRRSAPRAARA